MLPVYIRRFLVDPRRRVALSLTLVWLIAAWHYGFGQFLWWPAVCAVVAEATEVLWHALFQRRFIFNYSALVTGLLIGLLVYPGAYVLAVALPVAAIILKRLLYPKERPMFNPAALAIVLAALLLNVPTSWWGVAWSPWLGLALALSVLDVLWKLKLWMVPFTFLVGYAAYLSQSGGLAGAWPLLFDGTVLTFAFVMLPEPRSGVQGLPLIGKLTFPVVVLGSIVLLARWPAPSLDPLLTALLITSLLFSLRRLASKTH